MIDGVLCLAVRERRRRKIVRLGGSTGEGVREEIDEATLWIVSRTDDMDDSRIGIGAIVRRSSPLRRCRVFC